MISEETTKLLESLLKSLSKATSNVKELQKQLAGLQKDPVDAKQQDPKPKKSQSTKKDVPAPETKPTKKEEKPSQKAQPQHREKNPYKDAPKRRHPYMLFTSQMRKHLDEKMPVVEFSAIAKQKWDSLSEEQRKQYKEVADKENSTTFQRELEQYKKLHPEYDEHKRYGTKKKRSPNGKKAEVDGNLSESA